MSLSFLNKKEFFNLMKNLPEQSKSSAVKEIQKAAVEADAEATAKAPKITGKLAGSIDSEKTEDGANVFAGVDYAPYVEYGTRYKSAKPFMRPVIEKKRRQLKDKIKKSVTDNFNKTKI